MEVRTFINREEYNSATKFTLEEDTEDGSTAPFTQFFLEEVCSQL